MRGTTDHRTADATSRGAVARHHRRLPGSEFNSRTRPRVGVLPLCKQRRFGLPRRTGQNENNEVANGLGVHVTKRSGHSTCKELAQEMDRACCGHRCSVHLVVIPLRFVSPITNGLKRHEVLDSGTRLGCSVDSVCFHVQPGNRPMLTLCNGVTHLRIGQNCGTRGQWPDLISKNVQLS